MRARRQHAWAPTGLSWGLQHPTRKVEAGVLPTTALTAPAGQARRHRGQIECCRASPCDSSVLGASMGVSSRSLVSLLTLLRCAVRCARICCACLPWLQGTAYLQSQS